MNPRRRTLVLTGAAVLFRSALAQPSRDKLPRVGVVLAIGSSNPGYAAFIDELARLGYVAGRNLDLQPRFADGRLELLPAFAAEMVQMRADVIAVFGAVTVRAVRKVTGDIPVVFAVVLDPVADGLVADAKHPGGNTTGATNYDPAQPRAQMRLLKEVIPGLSVVAILGDAGVPDLLDQANKEAAEAEGLRPLNIRLKGASEDIEAVFARIREQQAGAVIGLEVPAVGVHGKRIVELSTASRIPTMFPADATRYGAMLSYGSSLSEAARRIAGMVDAILKGTKAGELPIQVVTKHRLTVNLPLAREIGVTIPPDLLARADEVRN